MSTFTDQALTRRGAVALALGSLLGTVGCGTERVGQHEGPQDSGVVVRDRAAEQAEAHTVASPLARALLGGELHTLRLIGDSITAGYGCEGYGATTERVIYDGAYGTFWETAETVSCGANDFRAYASSHGVADFVNAGIAGAKMRWLAEDAAAWLGEGADAVVVMLGTNDAVYHTEDELEEFALTGLEAAAAACDHLLVVAPPTNDRQDATNLIGPDVVERVLARVADARGWEFVSLYDALELGSDLIMGDQLHPTSKGSHALWDRLRGALGLP